MPRLIERIVLQPAHVAAFNYIKKYMSNKVFAPEISEIAKSIKVTNRHAYRLIDDLVTLGVISRENRRKRSIKIIKALTE